MTEENTAVETPEVDDESREIQELDQYGDPTPEQLLKADKAEQDSAEENEGRQEENPEEQGETPQIDDHVAAALKETFGYSDEVLSNMDPEMASMQLAAFDRARLAMLVQQEQHGNNSDIRTSAGESGESRTPESLSAEVKKIDRETYGDELADLVEGLQQQVIDLRQQSVQQHEAQYEHQVMQTADWFDKQFSSLPDHFHDMFGKDGWEKLTAAFDPLQQQQVNARSNAFDEFMRMQSVYPNAPKEHLFQRVMALYQPAITSKRQKTADQLQSRSKSTMLKPRKSQSQRKDEFNADLGMSDQDFADLQKLADQMKAEA